MSISVARWTVLFSFYASRMHLWSSGSRTAHGRRPSAPKGDHLSTRVRNMAMAARLSHGPTDFPQHLFSAHDHVWLRSNWAVHRPFTWPLRRPDCASSRLHSREYDRPVTQWMATPEPGCPGRHTREPKVSSKMSVPPRLLNIDHFSPALPVTLAHHLTATDNGGLLGRDR